MAARFWVGGTGTWDASDTTHWAATSGGAGGASVPGSSDTVTFDASSGGGVVTVNGNIVLSVAAPAFTAGAFTGTIDFSANNNNISAGSFSLTGTGARKFLGGSGTWTITGTNGSFDVNITTNLDPTTSFASTNIKFSANPNAVRSFNSGGLTYGSLEIANTGSTNHVPFYINNAPTITTFIPTNVPWVVLLSNATITNGFTWDGSSSAVNLLSSNGINGEIRTLTVGGDVVLSYATIWQITKAGAGSITANNSFDAGKNTGITITPPSGGGVIGVIGG